MSPYQEGCGLFKRRNRGIRGPSPPVGINSYRSWGRLVDQQWGGKPGKPVRYRVAVDSSGQLPTTEGVVKAMEVYQRPWSVLQGIPRGTGELAGEADVSQLLPALEVK